MKKPYKHIVLVAGEESGDQHAASLIDDIKAHSSDVHFSGIGGHHMQNAGAELIFNLAQYGVTGLASIVSHFKVIRQAFKLITKHLEQTKPDLLILIDYPGFNLRLAHYAKQKLDIKILYYISPQIWAWKAGRIKSIQKNIDHMAVIFPFEKAIYQNAGVPASFVGHPLIEKMHLVPDKATAKNKLNFQHHQTLVGLLPGSRRAEINYLLPIMIQSAERLYKIHPSLHFVLPVAHSVDPKLIQRHLNKTSLPITQIQGQAAEVMSACDVVIVASGTASLECALLQKPMCIVYKSSRLSYLIAMKVIQIRYLGLCNLLMNKMIVPELLQDDCREETLFLIMKALVEDSAFRERMQNRLGHLKHSLSTSTADSTIGQLAYNELGL